MQTAFVLGGGGVLGAHEIGMLRALSEAGIRPDLVVGTSLTLAFGLRRLRPGRMRGLRLLYFGLVWLAAEAAALFMCLGLWLASGFGGRLSTEPYRSRHYAIMGWYLGKVFHAATRTLGLRVEIDEPEPCGGEDGDRDGDAGTGASRPVIVLSRPRRPGPARQRGRYLAQPADGPCRPRDLVARAGGPGAALGRPRGAGAVAV